MARKMFIQHADNGYGFKESPIGVASPTGTGDAFQAVLLTEAEEIHPSFVNLSSTFQVNSRLAELDTPQKKLEARENLELQNIDCGEFF
jgi:GTPase SAR1 family protein